MRTGAAAGHRGYFHETAFYSSAEEFLAIVVPFRQGALKAGEPAVAALSDAKLTALPSLAGLPPLWASA